MAWYSNRRVSLSPTYFNYATTRVRFEGLLELVFFSALSQGTCVVLGIWEPGAITDNNTDLLKVGRMV